MLESIKRRRGGRDVRYVAPSDAEIASFAAWLRGVARGSVTRSVPEGSPPQGFELERFDEDRWLLAEQRQHRRGAGLVVLRAGPSAPIIIEAPHTFFDQGTLEIATSAFELLRARALLINTVRRTGSQDKDLDTDSRHQLARSGDAESDLAHAPASFFSAAHREFILENRRGVIVQLHGFRDERAPGASIVVSAAGTIANIEPLAKRMSEVFGDGRVRRYPQDIRHLGGMSNAQAELSRELGSPFVHVELSRTARENLRTDPELLKRFVSQLEAALVPAGTQPGAGD